MNNELVEQIDRLLERLAAKLEVQEKKIHALVAQIRNQRRQLQVHATDDVAQLVRSILTAQSVLTRASITLSTIEASPRAKRGKPADEQVVKGTNPKRATTSEASLPAGKQRKTRAKKEHKRGVHVIVLTLLRAVVSKGIANPPSNLEEALKLSQGDDWRDHHFNWLSGGKVQVVYYGDDLDSPNSHLREMMRRAKTVLEEVQKDDLQHQTWLVAEGLRQHNIQAHELLQKWLAS